MLRAVAAAGFVGVGVTGTASARTGGVEFGIGWEHLAGGAGAWAVNYDFDGDGTSGTLFDALRLYQELS